MRSQKFKYISGAIAFIAIAIGALLIFKGEKDIPDEDPDPIIDPTPVSVTNEIDVDAGSPNIQRIRRRPDGRLEIFWHIDTSAEDLVANYFVNAAGKLGYAEPHSSALPPDSRSWIDPTQRNDGANVRYSISARYENGQELYSQESAITYFSGPIPPVPEFTQATFQVIQGSPFVSLEWAQPQDSENRSSSFLLSYRSNEEETWTPIIDWNRPLRANHHYLPVPENTAEAIQIQLIGLNDIQQESPPALTRIDNLLRSPPRPRNLKAVFQSESGGPINLSWEFQDNFPITGFRIFENGLLAADESQLGPNIRAWQDGALIAESSYKYGIVAVADTGLVSQADLAPEFSIASDQIPQALLAPSGFVVNWAASEQGLSLELNWENPNPESVALSGYLLEYAKPGDDGFVAILGGDLLTKPSHSFVPDTAAQAYDFKLYSVASDGRKSAATLGSVPAPIDFMPTARLLDYQIYEEGETQRLEWFWKYPNSPLLKGFRIFEDGELVADEAELGPDARAWLSGSLAKETIYKFEIEAVSLNGESTVRGPPQSYEPL